MRRMVIFLCVLAALPVAAQDKSADSQTLRELLQEVRLLRRDLQTTTVAAQRVQIALYRLQLQDAAVARASRVADDAREHLGSITEQRKQLEAQKRRLEEIQNPDPMQRREIEEATPQFKMALDRLDKEQEQWQAKSSDADAQLRVEQGKLDRLHGVLDELEEALANVGKSQK